MNPFEAKLQGKIRRVRNIIKNGEQIKNNDLLFILDEVYQDYKNYSTKITLTREQGESSFEVVDLGDTITAVTYSKHYLDTKGDFEYKKQETNIEKKDLAILIKIIQNWYNKQDIILKSTRVAGEFCYKKNWWTTDKGVSLFKQDNSFIWDNFQSWRKQHNRFSIMLRILRHQEIIFYRGGNIELCK